MWFLIIGLAWLLVALAAVIVARPREGWKNATQVPAEDGSPSPVEDRLEWTLAMAAAYDMPCPEGIAYFERCVEYGLKHGEAA